MEPNLIKIDISLKERKEAIHSVSKIKNEFVSLQHNLYIIENKKIINENVYRYRINFIEECQIFKVHFPSQPIVPGSCIVDIVKELIEDFQNQKMALKEANNICFYSLLSPITDPVLDFYFEEEELPDNENLEEHLFSHLYKVFLLLRKKDTLQDEGVLAEMHLVLEPKL